MVNLSSTLAALAVAVAAAGLPPPTWPNTFNVTFTEVTSVIVSNNSFTGSWAYDWTNVRQRIDRSTGKYDRYCGTTKSDDSPCTHLVVNGVRYLWWPQLQYCCSCCTDAQGCGVVTPTWMVDSNGTYTGRSNVSTPTWSGVADAWQIDGLQPNDWLQTTSGTPAPVELGMVPDDYQYYNPGSYSSGLPQPDALFTVPAYCTQKCAFPSICSFLAPTPQENAHKGLQRPMP